MMMDSFSFFCMKALCLQNLSKIGMHISSICLPCSYGQPQRNYLDALYPRKPHEIWKCSYMENYTVAITILFAITNDQLLIFFIIWFILFIRLLFPYWLWQWVIPYTLFGLRRTVGVTHQRMLTPPWHLIILSHLSEVCFALHSILYLFFGLWLRLTYC
jgi:hypothetical protein